MRTQSRHAAAWTRSRIALLVALPLLAGAPVAARALAAESEEAAGTQFLHCSDTAWANYNKCLMDSSHEWEKKLCDIVFDADIVWCGSVYWRRIKTGM